MQDKESPPKEGLKNLTSLEKLEIFCNVPIWCRFPKRWVASHLSLRAKMPERNWWDWAKFLTSQKFSISLGFGLNYCSTTYMLIYAPLDVFFFQLSKSDIFVFEFHSSSSILMFWTIYLQFPKQNFGSTTRITEWESSEKGKVAQNCSYSQMFR